jgi:primase-polymerase (primpol)-like protein
MTATAHWTIERRDDGLNGLSLGLAVIADLRVFGAWALEPNGPGKPRKVAYVAPGRKLVGSYSDPELPKKLLTLSDAIKMVRASRALDGVALAFYPGCGVLGLDLDNCCDAATGKPNLSPPQKAALDIFRGAGCFLEWSVSGLGLHAIARGNGNTNKANGVVELFGDKNFLALTGNGKGIVR